MGSAGARVESSDYGIFVVLQLFSQLARAKPVNRFDKQLSNNNFAKFTDSLSSFHRITTPVFALGMTLSLAIFVFSSVHFTYGRMKRRCRERWNERSKPHG